MVPRLSPAPRALLFTGIALLSAGCGNDFQPPSKVNSVRVLAVRAEGTPRDSEIGPASGVPGDTIRLEMLYADGTPKGDEPERRALQIAWLAGCHNPPSRFYYGCEPKIRELSTIPPTDLPRGTLGFGPSFEVTIPEDILTSAPRIASDPLHFGVSYVFFSLCAGTFAPDPSNTEGVPLKCVDSAGNPRGPKDFVTGFHTLYTYEDVTNHNPELGSVTFAGLPAAGANCSGPEPCLPVVPYCTTDKCTSYAIVPRATKESFEHTPDGKSEILWASFYATSGSLGNPQQLVADRNKGPVEDYSTRWTPPRLPTSGPREPERVRLWVTLNDERGGADWASFEVLVE